MNNSHRGVYETKAPIHGARGGTTRQRIETIECGVARRSVSMPCSRSCASEGDYRLIYFGEHQPALWAAGLPKDDREIQVDVIDAWNMTVTPAKRVPCPVYPRLRQRGGALTEQKPIATFAVKLEPRPYQAIRIRPVRSEQR